MFYKELTFHIVPHVEDIADALIAALGDIGYDSFSYTDDGFRAYIPSDRFRQKDIDTLDALAFLRKDARDGLVAEALADRAADAGTAAGNDRNFVRSFCHLFHSSSSQRCARRLDVRTGRCCLGNSCALLLLLHCKFSCEESEVCVRYPL